MAASTLPFGPTLDYVLRKLAPGAAQQTAKQDISISTKADIFIAILQAKLPLSSAYAICIGSEGLRAWKDCPTPEGLDRGSLQ